jgi:hypothetical protein
MARSLILFGVSLAFAALVLGILARFLARRSLIGTTYAHDVDILLPLAIIVGALPSVFGVENVVLSVTASLISIALTTAAIYLLWRSQRS